MHGALAPLRDRVQGRADRGRRTSPSRPAAAAPLRQAARFRPLPARGRRGGGLAATSVRFRAGWVASDSPDTPDKVDVSTDRRELPAGQTSRKCISSPPFAGHATLLTLTDRVHSLRDARRAGGRHHGRRAGGRGLGTRRLCHGARVPRPGDGTRPDARDRAGLGRHRPGRAHAAAGASPRRTRSPPRRACDRAGDDRARRLGDARRGRRGRAAADRLQVAGPGGALPRPPAARARHPRRLGPADPAGRGRRDRAAARAATTAAARCRRSRRRSSRCSRRRCRRARTGWRRSPLDLPDFNGQVRLMAVAWQGSQVGGASTPT